MSDDTTQRDELARDIFIADNSSHPDAAADWDTLAGAGFTAHSGYAYDIADGLIAKGYRKPRTITTLEELDALAKGTTILDAGNMGAQWDGEMWSGEGRWWHSTQIAFPATVLYEPEAEATNIDFALATAAAAGVPLTEEQVREHIANNQQSEAESTR